MGTTDTREQTLARITQAFTDGEISADEMLEMTVALAGTQASAPTPTEEASPEAKAALAKIRQLRPDITDMHALPKSYQQLAWAAYTDDARDQREAGKADARALTSTKILASDVEPKAGANPHKLTAAQAKHPVTIHGTEMSFGEFIGHVLACEIRVPRKARVEA